VARSAQWLQSRAKAVEERAKTIATQLREYDRASEPRDSSEASGAAGGREEDSSDRDAFAAEEAGGVASPKTQEELESAWLQNGPAGEPGTKRAGGAGSSRDSGSDSGRDEPYEAFDAPAPDLSRDASGLSASSASSAGHGGARDRLAGLRERAGELRERVRGRAEALHGMLGNGELREKVRGRAEALLGNGELRERVRGRAEALLGNGELRERVRGRAEALQGMLATTSTTVKVAPARPAGRCARAARPVTRAGGGARGQTWRAAVGEEIREFARDIGEAARGERQGSLAETWQCVPSASARRRPRAAARAAAVTRRRARAREQGGAGGVAREGAGRNGLGRGVSGRAQQARPRSPRCVRLVRGEGRDVSAQYEGRDEMCPLSARGGTRCVLLVRGEGRDVSA